MKRIKIDDLPKWSPWPARLLGMSEWKDKKRDLNSVKREYDGDKYLKCLDYIEKCGRKCNLMGIKTFELGGDLSVKACISRGSGLEIMSLRKILDIYHELLVSRLRLELLQSAAVVELGCGYGWNLGKLNLDFPGLNMIGGDYSPKAVLIAEYLFKDNPHVNVRQFNYYDADYDIFEGVDGPVTVFTSHSIEQLPRAECVFEGLKRYRKKIRSVFHFEPGYELHEDNSLMSIMRKRYIEVNDYNRDLVSQIKVRNRDIKVVSMEKNVLGTSFNPTTVMHWRYKS